MTAKSLTVLPVAVLAFAPHIRGVRCRPLAGHPQMFGLEARRITAAMDSLAKKR